MEQSLQINDQSALTFHLSPDGPMGYCFYTSDQSIQGLLSRAAISLGDVLIQSRSVRLECILAPIDKDVVSVEASAFDPDPFNARRFRAVGPITAPKPISAVYLPTITAPLTH